MNIERGRQYGSFTNILFPKNSFSRGMARVINVFPTLGSNPYNASKSVQEADSKALRSDWFTIGNDIRNVKECLKNGQKPR